jgi:isoquinoline 1-oxidoreductase alpha subunit
MVELTVNGKERSFDGDGNMPILWYLRDELGLTGTKFGCGKALCGACTVHLDGQAIRSCITPMVAAEGRQLTTIEGLHPSGEHPVQKAWQAINVPQCGYCQTGQIMQAAALLASNPDPSDQDIVNGMSGNICRCGTYPRILKAVRSAAQEARDEPHRPCQPPRFPAHNRYFRQLHTGRPSASAPVHRRPPGRFHGPRPPQPVGRHLCGRYGDVDLCTFRDGTGCAHWHEHDPRRRTRC